MNLAEQARELARLRRLLRSGQARAIRQRAAVSMLAIARQLDVRESTVSRWESGVTTPRDPKLALAYLRLLDELATVPNDDDHQGTLAAAGA